MKKISKTTFTAQTMITNTCGVRFAVGERPCIIVETSEGMFLGSTDVRGDWATTNGNDDNIHTIERVAREALRRMAA